MNPCAKQLRTAHGSVCIDDQTAVGFVVKERLRNSEDDERIKSAADDRQNERRQDCAANFRKEFFHKLGEVESSDDEIDELDADKRNDDAAEAVDEQVALQNRERAHRFVGNAAQRQRNQRDDDERVENDRAENGAGRAVQVHDVKRRDRRETSPSTSRE